jgi:hypothetical protein
MPNLCYKPCGIKQKADSIKQKASGFTAFRRDEKREEKNGKWGEKSSCG